MEHPILDVQQMFLIRKQLYHLRRIKQQEKYISGPICIGYDYLATENYKDFGKKKV